MLLAGLVIGTAAVAATSTPHVPPPTRVDDVVETLHGVEVPDPYRWLEDGGSPEVRAWTEGQNAFTRRHLDGLAGREWLERRLTEVSYVDAVGVPRRAGSRLFFTRRKPDQEKAVLYWRGPDNPDGTGGSDGTGGADHVLVDPAALAADGSVSLGEWVASPDGTTLAYALSENNADEATLYVKDVATGEVSVRDRIEGAKYATPSWTPDGDGFYYTWVPTDPGIPVAERPGRAEVRYHALGTDPGRDPVIRAATNDPGRFVGAEVSHDGRWLVAYVTSFSENDVYFRDLRSPDDGWRTLVAGEPARFSVSVWQDRFYVQTDDGASRRRLLRVDPSVPARDRWEEIVPEAADAVLEDTDVVGGQLALTYLRNAATEIELRALDGRPLRTVPLPGVGSSSGLVGTPDGDEVFFSFSSFTVPPEVWRLSVATGAAERWARREVPVDPSPYVVEQVFFPSKDGTRIPMFLVHRRDAPRDGSTPFLLTGYGGFAVNVLPTFSGHLYPWLEAGGGYAVPNLRGGAEYGEDWHRAGMLEHKQNTFDDFVAAAEYLVGEGWTEPERLAIRGGSNGGLLVGAALTQRPDLFRAVICSVPLLDMIRYHRFGSGRTWVSEYGTADRPEDFGWLSAYSPYHRVQTGVSYPAVLFASSDSDDRVDPLHARKMAAALQAAGPQPVLLRIEANAGHGGADLVSSAVAESVDQYAFLFSRLGMRAPS